MAYDFKKHYGPVNANVFVRSRTVDISSADFEDENGFVAIAPASSNLTFTLLGDTAEVTESQAANTAIKYKGETVLLKQLKENSSHSAVIILYPTM